MTFAKLWGRRHVWKRTGWYRKCVCGSKKKEKKNICVCKKSVSVWILVPGFWKQMLSAAWKPQSSCVWLRVWMMTGHFKEFTPREDSDFASLKATVKLNYAPSTQVNVLFCFSKVNSRRGNKKSPRLLDSELGFSLEQSSFVKVWI